MKSVIALIVLVGATVAQANTFKGPFDTTDYNCYDLRKKINLNGQLSLTVDGGKKQTFVADPALSSNCSSDQEARTVFVKTADFQGCPLYKCVKK